PTVGIELGTAGRTGSFQAGARLKHRLKLSARPSRTRSATSSRPPSDIEPQPRRDVDAPDQRQRAKARASARRPAARSELVPSSLTASTRTTFDRAAGRPEKDVIAE